ncbi:MAG: 23S rRNA accumulation protein YceD [Colwellia sp.]|nr:23S rRNA accumulation protein YceD [Colwellia sp.]
MQNLKLPITIDPKRSAQRKLVCEGRFELSGMNRLLAVCENTSEQVKVNVNFNMDERGLIVISGTSSVLVTLICQRCTDAFEQLLEVSFTFSPVKDADEEAELPSYYDAIELDENGEINLRELVEDELLLEIPLIPRHSIEDCKAPADSVWGELPEELEKPNPFDVLKQLK